MSDFNPYREWLGIKTKGSVSYYELLGVTRADSPERIRNQASRLVRMLKQIDAGEHDTEKRQLIDRVRRAAKRLTDPELKRAYDKKLARKARQVRPREAPSRKADSSFLKETVHAKEVTTIVEELEEESTTSVKVPSEPAAEVRSTHDVAVGKKDTAGKNAGKSEIGVRHDTGKTVADELVRLRPRKRHIAPAYKANRRKSQTAKITILLAVFSLCGIGYLLLTQTQLGRQMLSTVWQPVSHRQTASPVASNAESTSALPLHNDQINSDQQTTPNEQTSTTPNTTSTDSPLNNFEPQTSRPSTDTTMFDSDTPPTSQLLESLQLAKRLLGERKATQAKVVLEEARQLATDPSSRARVARMTTLATYVESYWNAAQKQIASFRAGNEAEIGGQRVMVVEKSSEKLIIRTAGRNRTIDLTNLSQGLAETLANEWLDSTAPSTKVFRGAMKCVTPGYEVEEARQLWRETELSGEVKLGDLPKVLDELRDYSK